MVRIASDARCSTVEVAERQGGAEQRRTLEHQNFLGAQTGDVARDSRPCM